MTNAYFESVYKTDPYDEVQVFRGIDENPTNDDRGRVRTQSFIYLLHYFYTTVAILFPSYVLIYRNEVIH